jgi:NAD(P)-dependent dehydrogenase (short-subunit alcohol dehydrogenase family)
MAPAETVPIDTWRKIIDVNLNGTYFMSRAAIPVMKSQQSGRIVNQASIAAYLAAPMLIHYDVSKAAVISLTKVLARELGEFNITVNCIVPGIVTTEATMDTLDLHRACAR